LRAVSIVLMLVAMSCPVPARAQADADVVPVIQVHPRVATILQLPEAIEDAWITDGAELRVAIVGEQLYIRPRPGTPAGMEATLEVQTSTRLRTFRLLVVRRARDAQRDVLVPPPERPRHIERAVLLTPPVFAMVPPTPAPAEPAAPTAPSPLLDAPEPAESATTAETKRDTAATRSPRFALSMHALGALGTTAFHVAGYEAANARQSHGAGGVRVACHPHDTWWSVEANVSGELPVTPTRHARDDADEHADDELSVAGPRLRADVALRGRLGTARLIPNFHTGIGLQAHYLDIQVLGDPQSSDRTSDLPFEGVLSLGMGLEYRAGNVLLGLDLHVRQGMSGDYRSVSGLVSVGFFLDQGE
jgi:hypothetical protein